MARTFATPPTLPDQLGIAAGEDILAADFEALGDTCNHLHGDGRCQPAVVQHWSSGGFVDSGAALTLRCQWRIPRLSGAHTLLKCRVRAQHTSGSTGSGVIEFRSTTAADTCTLTIGPTASPAWVDSIAGAGANQHLTIDPGAGFETIEMYTRGDLSGTYATSLLDVSLEYDALTSPLAAGVVVHPAGLAGATEVVPVDTDDVSADSPLTSDLGYDLIATLDALEGRPRVYFQWSEADGITVTGGDFDGQNPRKYQSTMPVHRGTGSASDDSYELTYHAYVSGASDSLVFHGQAGLRDDSDGAEAAPYMTVVPGGGGGKVWATGTLRLEELFALLDSPYPMGRLGFYGYPGAERIHALSIWGR